MEFEIDKGVEILSRTPQTLRHLLGGLSDEWVSGESAEDSWDPFDIVGHLIHGEETDWIPRARIILAQGEDLEFVPFDMIAHFENSKGRSLSELLERFTTLRAENLQSLAEMNLNDDRLELKGIHPALGEVTLRELLSTWVVHDLNHIRQIVVAMAKRYDGNVGPWREYLSILQ